MIEFSSEEIEALQEAIARQLGFKLVGHRLELYDLHVSPAAAEKSAEPPKSAFQYPRLR